MAIVLSEAVAAFTVRCKLSRTPAAMAAAAPANPLTINFTDAAWARILTCIRDGGLLVAAPTTLPALHDYIRSIVLPAGQPDPFTIHPADWAFMPAWAPRPGGATRARPESPPFPLHVDKGSHLRCGHGEGDRHRPLLPARV